MESGVIFYELEHPYVYESSVLHNFYVVAVEPQVLLEPGPIIDDYIPESPPVDLDMSIESLSTCFSDPFTIEPIVTSTAAFGQPSVVGQVSPSCIAFACDSSDGSPQSTSEVIVISDDEDIEEI
ncbi:hypothetical protein AHAS_Ahas19G0120800 [Arachis hypogaea]